MSLYCNVQYALVNMVPNNLSAEFYCLKLNIKVLEISIRYSLKRLDLCMCACVHARASSHKSNPNPDDVKLLISVKHV
jgi:hypothetical protein